MKGAVECCGSASTRRRPVARLPEVVGGLRRIAIRVPTAASANQVAGRLSRRRRSLFAARQHLGNATRRLQCRASRPGPWPRWDLMQAERLARWLRWTMSLWCARLTGEGQPVEVRRKEGVTNHFRPESCAGRCEAAGEALTGARTGRAIEHRKRERLERRDCHSGRRQHRHHRNGEGMAGSCARLTGEG